MLQESLKTLHVVHHMDFTLLQGGNVCDLRGITLELQQLVDIIDNVNNTKLSTNILVVE